MFSFRSQEHLHPFFEPTLYVNEKNTNSIEKLFEKYIAMAHGGYKPLPDYDVYEPSGLYDYNDDDNADQTGAFVPFSSSTPGPYGQEIEFQTAQKKRSSENSVFA